jgi:hypothetical protein
MNSFVSISGMRLMQPEFIAAEKDGTPRANEIRIVSRNRAACRRPGI